MVLPFKYKNHQSKVKSQMDSKQFESADQSVVFMVEELQHAWALHKLVHNPGMLRVCGLGQQRKRRVEGCNAVKATEMPSQSKAISCPQAAGTIIGCSLGSVDTLQRKSYFSLEKETCC